MIDRSRACYLAILVATVIIYSIGQPGGSSDLVMSFLRRVLPIGHWMQVHSTQGSWLMITRIMLC
jgi:hypothetical protein